MKKYQLGEFEELVILTVAILDNDAYGISIKNEIESRAARTVSLGALHAARFHEWKRRVICVLLPEK